jgi:hypothetical protein
MGAGSFPGVKRPGRSVYHPPLSSAEVKGRAELFLYCLCGLRRGFNSDRGALFFVVPFLTWIVLNFAIEQSQTDRYKPDAIVGMEYLYGWLHRLASGTYRDWSFLRYCIQTNRISVRFDVCKCLITVRLFLLTYNSCCVIVNILVNIVQCWLLIRSLTPVQGCHPLQRTVFKLVLILKAPFASCVCVCVRACIRECICLLIQLRIVQYYTQDLTDFDEKWGKPRRVLARIASYQAQGGIVPLPNAKWESLPVEPA